MGFSFQRLPRDESKSKSNDGDSETVDLFVFRVWHQSLERDWEAGSRVDGLMMLMGYWVCWVVATSNIFLFFTSKFGERGIHFDDNIFQMGWFNHQPGLFGSLFFIDFMCFFS